MQSFFQAAVSSISRVQFKIARGYKRSRKTKLGDLSEIIHQKLPIFDTNFFIKAQKNSIIFKVFGTQGIRPQALKNKTQSFVYKFCSRKAFNGFRRLKKITMKACAEFYCRQIAEKILSKIPAVHYEPRRVDTLRPVCFCFGPSPSAECLCSTS